MKVSLVGHSQLPYELYVEGAEIKIFRAPGGRADSFFNDERLNSVLNWPHDLCILWLGSNDIEEDTVVGEVVDNITEIIDEISK